MIGGKAFLDEDGRHPGDNAFRALKKVYKLFGLPPTAIPFKSDSVIAEELIIQEAARRT